MSELTRALIELLEADSAMAALRIVTRCPQLLEAAADEILQLYQEQQDEGDGEEVEQAQGCRQFLDHCREVGLEHVADEVLLDAFFDAPTMAQAVRLISAQPELLSPRVAALLSDLAASEEDDERRAFVAMHSSLLDHCREVGLEQALIDAEMVELENLAEKYGQETSQLLELIDAYEQFLARWPDTQALRAPVLHRLGRIYIGLALEEDPSLESITAMIASGHERLGDTRQNRYLGMAIEYLEECRRSTQVEVTPQEYGQVLHDLGTAYLYCFDEQQSANVKRAIARFQEALGYRGLDTDREAYLLTRMQLGHAHQRAGTGEHLAQAASCFEDVLRCRGPQDDVLASHLHYLLGQTYAELKVGGRQEYLNNALQQYAEALRCLPQDAPDDTRATIHFSIAAAHLEMPSAAQREHWEQAIAHLRQALSLCPVHEAPLQHAVWRVNLGNALLTLPGRRSADLDEAIVHAREALCLVNEDQEPKLYQLAQELLGRASLALQTPDRIEGYHAAVNSLEDLLRFQDPGTRDHFRLHKELSIYHHGLAAVQQAAGDRGVDGMRRDMAQSVTVYEQKRDAGAEGNPAALLRLAQTVMKMKQGDLAVGMSEGLAACREALRALPPDTTSVEVAANLQDFATLGLLLARAADAPAERERGVTEVISAFTDALTVRTAAAMPLAYAQTQRRLGDAYALLRGPDPQANLRRAIVCYQEALRFITTETNPREYADIQHCMGLAFSAIPTGKRATDLERASACYQEALRFRTQKDAPIAYAQTSKALARVYAELSATGQRDHLRQAIAYLEQALEVFGRADLPQDHAEVQGTSAGLSHALMRFAGDLADSRSTECADAQLHLGICLHLLPGPHAPEHLRRIITCYEEALRVYVPQRHPGEYARVRFHLAEAYYGMPAQDRHATRLRARACYEEALRYLDRQADPGLYARAKAGLGAIQLELAAPDATAPVREAITWFEEGLQAISKETHPAVYAQLHRRLGHLYQRLPEGRAENLRRAIASLDQALSVCGEDYDALIFAQNQSDMGRALLLLRELNVTSQEGCPLLQRAMDCFRRSVRHLTPLNTPLECRTANLHLGDLAFARRDYRQALDAYAAAIEAGERLFQASLYPATQTAELAENAALYQNAAFSAACLGEDEQALLILERGKTRLLAQALRIRTMRPAGVSDRVWMSFEGAARRFQQAQVQILPDQVHHSEAHAAEVRSAAAALDAAVAMVRQGAPPFLRDLDAAVLRALVQDERTAVISLCITSHGTLGFVVTRGEMRTVAVPGFTRATLAALIQGESGGWHAALARLAPDVSMEALLARLGRELLAPLLAVLPAAVERITFLPALETFLLPLHAAILPSGERVLDRFQVGYAPSAQVFERLPQREPEELSLYAVVNPGEDARMAMAFAEGEAIAALFQQREVDAGRRVTEERVRAGVAGHTHVHFICHGQFTEGEPKRTGLLLGHAELLSLFCLQDSPLDLAATRLVTLSACSTGVIDVRVRNVLEYIGLPAGFLLSGAPCVVCALWPVPDLPSAMLLTRFYENHIAQRMDPVAALSAAQRWLGEQTVGEIQGYLERYNDEAAPRDTRKVMTRYRLAYKHQPLRERPFRHPFYWAGFVAYGR